MDFIIKKVGKGSPKKRLEHINEDRLNDNRPPLTLQQLFEYETATRPSDPDYEKKFRDWLRG